MASVRANRTPDTQEWWVAVSLTVDRPDLIRDLQRDGVAACEPREAQDAIAWARTLHGWSDASPPLELVESPELRSVGTAAA